MKNIFVLVTVASDGRGYLASSHHYGRKNHFIEEKCELLLDLTYVDSKDRLTTRFQKVSNKDGVI